MFLCVKEKLSRLRCIDFLSVCHYLCDGYALFVLNFERDL